MSISEARTTLTGLVIAEDPQAAAIGQDVLLNGGTAADAAVAVASALAVTVPSRAGFGGGGRCLVSSPSSKSADILDFRSAAASPDRDARWRAGRPIFARGLYALHARYGRLTWQQVIIPAENLARFGFLVPQRLADDLANAGDKLMNDRTALAMFLTSDRRLAVGGDRLRNLDLAAVFARIRGRGPGGMFDGHLAKEIADAAARSGVSIGVDDLREAVPKWARAGLIDNGVYYTEIDPPLDLGSPDLQVNAGERDADSGTSILIVDQNGMVVGCHFDMNALFGVGLVATGQGMLFAAAPAGDVRPPIFMVERTKTDGLAFMAGVFAGESANNDARAVHALSAKGIVDAKALQAALQDEATPRHFILFSCKLGLIDGGEGCRIHSNPENVATWLMTSSNSDARY